VTSPFGNRLHPVLHIWRLHAGVDLVRAGGAATTGSKLFAIAPGKVTGRLTVAQNPGGGNFVEIKHADGTFSRYFHMRAASLLHVGDRVQEGDVVGRLGNTGSWSTGPHLHFEVLTKRRRPVDPVAFIERRLSDPTTTAVAAAASHDEAEDTEEEDDEMRTIQVHYIEDDGKVIRALITPGTGYFAPWQESGHSIADGMSRALTGPSVAVTKKMFEMLRQSAQKLEPKDLELAIPISNVDGPILEDPDAFPLDSDGIPLEPIVPEPGDLNP
jgi:hypothetical protein